MYTSTLCSYIMEGLKALVAGKFKGTLRGVKAIALPLTTSPPLSTSTNYHDLLLTILYSLYYSILREKRERERRLMISSLATTDNGRSLLRSFRGHFFLLFPKSETPFLLSCYPPLLSLHSSSITTSRRTIFSFIKCTA